MCQQLTRRENTTATPTRLLARFLYGGPADMVVDLIAREEPPLGSVLEQDRLYRRVQSVSDRGDAAEQGSNDSSPGKNIVVGLVFQHNQNCVKGFFQELQSKRIFRVGGGYII
jgi:hypothetical protein